MSDDHASVRLLVELFHGELQRLAHHERLRFGGRSATLNTTALVHEAYLKLAREDSFRDRGHFLATAALAMRQVLVGEARRRLSDKRGRGESTLPLDAVEIPLSQPEARIVALDEALQRLALSQPRLAQVVECRYFAGYTEPETAEALGVTDRTVQRDWAKARALLYEALAD
ncbi:MAG TPA: ECF-type sigma factor [Xanthomonadaceae bacterium]|nr:ECF-type sigma factor [Xanthomonadaceae bacterium]